MLAGGFITDAQGAAGLRFTPTSGLASYDHPFGFDIQASLTPDVSGRGGKVIDAAVTVVDITPPTSRITSVPAAYTPATTASFVLSGTDNGTARRGLKFEASLDGASYATVTANPSYAALAEGQHTLLVRAIDEFGNVQAVPTSYTWIVDHTPPVVTLGAPSAGITAGGPVTYTVTYSDANLASVSLTANQVNLIGTGSAAGLISVSGTGFTRTVTISGITGDGTLDISIAAGTATDLAGNVALRPPPGRHSWWTTLRRSGSRPRPIWSASRASRWMGLPYLL